MFAVLLDPILHAVLALALLVAYCVLRLAGTEEPLLLGMLAGQLTGLGVTQVAERVRVGVASTSSPSSSTSLEPAVPPKAGKGS
jgi:hypothetical protein